MVCDPVERADCDVLTAGLKAAQIGAMKLDSPRDLDLSLAALLPEGAQACSDLSEAFRIDLHNVDYKLQRT